MEYVSVCCVSAGATEWVTPERPPMVNIVMRPQQNSSGVSNFNLPPHMVAVQLRIFTPVGTAMNIVVRENTVTDIGPIPETNMWWAHTPQPMKPMATPENTMNG